MGEVARSEILLRRRVIAGGPAEFLTVHHLELRGTQVEIGAALAAEARHHFGWRPPTAGDPVRNRARRKWFERNWPEHHARMAGVAKAFDLDIDDDALDFANVMAEPFNGNCSGVWCSSLLGADGHARLGRNLDFSTRTLSEMLGAPPEPEEPPVLSRPFVIETSTRAMQQLSAQSVISRAVSMVSTRRGSRLASWPTMKVGLYSRV